jgi:hypothetical protein
MFRDMLVNLNHDNIRLNLPWTPVPKFVACPKNEYQLSYLFNTSPAGVYVKPVELPTFTKTIIDDRKYIAKHYTKYSELVADIVSEHGSLDVFFGLQALESKFELTQTNIRQSPCYLQEFLDPAIYTETIISGWSNTEERHYFDPALVSSELDKMIYHMIMYFPERKFFTLKVKKSSSVSYITEMSYSLHPLLAMTVDKGARELLKMQFSLESGSENFDAL